MQAVYHPFIMTGSPSTYIKEENDDFSFNPHQYSTATNGRFNMNQQYGQFTSGGDMSAVNPTDLTMGSMTNGYGQMSGSFMGTGNSGIDDEDLLALGNLDEQKQQFQTNGYGQVQQGQNFFPNGQGYTPDTNPIASPFLNQQGDFFNQYSNSAGQQFNGMQRRPMGSMERHPSDAARSPMTPNQQMRIGSIGTPDSNHLQYQVPLNQHLNHHAKMQSASWNQNGNSGSAGSGWDSPLSSPMADHFHPGLAEVMHGRAPASLPAKVENGMHTNFQTQEAKKKRRRESHNAVERRRRDNINERIHDLSRLVPSHRLEDEKVRKHLSNNGPLSPTLGATGMSPPAATSLLAGGAGRRAAGNITQGLPLEEKDKGPNKGDILNGAVSWTRDMMWQLYQSYKNEEQLRALMESQGLQWPLSETEDQKRMKTELITAVEKNGKDNFEYSRGPGSGLRVPGHTAIDGSAVNGANGTSSVSPSSANGQNFNWLNDPNHRDSFSLKEEDESSFGMDMG